MQTSKPSKPSIFLRAVGVYPFLSIHSSSINMRFALLLSLAAVSNGAVAPQKSLDEPLDQSTLDAVDGVTRSPVAVPTQAYDDEGNHVSNIELDGTVTDDVATAAADAALRPRAAPPAPR